MPITTDLTRRLGIQHPIVQAPMAGGGDTPRLVAAVSEAGALGCIGAAYLTPQQIVETARTVRSLSSRPFGINLFAPQRPPGPPKDTAAVIQRVAPLFAEVGLPPPAAPALPADIFADQVAACLESGAALFSFTLGTLPESAMKALKQRGLLVVGTATTVELIRRSAAWNNFRKAWELWLMTWARAFTLWP